MNKVVLVGSPNTGKTTLYNTITGQNEKASNYGGVTVEVKNAPLLLDKNTMVYDLPGLYSIETFSPEEKVSLNFLNANKDALIVNICDANNLYRNLFLALELKEMGLNICLAINMANGIKNIETIAIDLEKELGIKCFIIDARKRKKCTNLLKFLQNCKPNAAKLQKYCKKTNNQNEDYAALKYKEIDKILTKCGYKIYNEKLSKLDNFLFKPHVAIASFLILFLVVFYITFGSVGQTCSNFLSSVFSQVSFFLLPWLKNSSGWFASFVRDGMIGAMCSVLTFLPQIMFLNFFLNLMEDTGYLSRVAFALDGKLNRIGLSGRSVFSLLLGFGCTTSAYITTRNIENNCIRRRTALVLPYFSCSAKLPIFALICSVFFGTNRFLAVMAFYALGVIIGIILSIIDFKISGAKINQNFILEMPKLKAPYLQKIIKDAYFKTKEFALRVGSVICLASAIIWFASHFNFRLEFTEELSNASIVGQISNYIAPIFKPLGFSAVIVLALFSGLIAKEMVVSTLMLASGSVTILELQTIIDAGEGVFNLTTASAVALLVFVLLYPVCVSAMMAERQELGVKIMIKSVILQFLLAYSVSYLVYNLMLGKIMSAVLILLAIISVAIFVCYMIKYKSKRKVKFYACESKCSQNCMHKKL